MPRPLLGQWIPLREIPGGAPRPSTGDPISTALFQRIEELTDRFGALWTECTNWTKEWETLMETRVGLAPALYEDPRNIADPGMQRAYYEAHRYCDLLDVAAAELAQTRAQFRAHVARRAAAMRTGSRIRIGAFPLRVPYY